DDAVAAAGYAARVPRTAVLTPFAFPSVRGNAVTAERIVGGLNARGEDVRMWDMSAAAEADIAAAVEAWRPSLLPALHAFPAGAAGAPHGPAPGDSPRRHPAGNRRQSRVDGSGACAGRPPGARRGDGRDRVRRLDRGARGRRSAGRARSARHDSASGVLRAAG